MTKEEAKNLGFIAKMNGIERAPIRDKKFSEMISDVKLMQAWLSGWDECNLEYATYPGRK